MDKTMDVKAVLMLASMSIVFLLGLAHLIFTFWGPKLLPRDANLIASMKVVPLVITTETTVWKAWIGFNVSHSVALIFFSLAYGYLAIVQPGVLFASPFLLLLGFFMHVGFIFLCWAYWFSAPFVGISAALIFYVASIFLVRT